MRYGLGITLLFLVYAWYNVIFSKPLPYREEAISILSTKQTENSSKTSVKPKMISSFDTRGIKKDIVHTSIPRRELDRCIQENNNLKDRLIYLQEDTDRLVNEAYKNIRATDAEIRLIRDDNAGLVNDNKLLRLKLEEQKCH